RCPRRRYGPGRCGNGPGRPLLHRPRDRSVAAPNVATAIRRRGNDHARSPDRGGRHLGLPPRSHAEGARGAERPVKPHAIDPFSFVFGLLFALMRWFFLTGDRSLADIGSTSVWPVPLLALGLLMVLSAGKRIYSGMARSPHEDQTVQLEPEDEPGQAACSSSHAGGGLRR